MHDFGKLVYMDLQKSGSTFVSEFLNRTCTLPLVREEKHGRIDGWSYNKRAFYFITVRHPIAQYSSLFRYGLDRRGGLFERLSAFDKADLYGNSAESFNQWLRFVLDCRNAPMLGEDFEKVSPAYNLGFLSFRYVMLSLRRPLKTLLKKPESLGVLEYVKKMSIVNHVILNERLNEGLLELARHIRPEFFDQRLVDEFFSSERKVNTSTVTGDAINDIDDDVIELISKKEKILLEFYLKTGEL